MEIKQTEDHSLQVPHRYYSYGTPFPYQAQYFYPSYTGVQPYYSYYPYNQYGAQPYQTYNPSPPYGQQMYPSPYTQQDDDGVEEVLPYLFHHHISHHRDLEWTNEQLKTSLYNAILGEHNAIACYDQLAQMAPDEPSKRIILEIRKDEIRHYQSLLKYFVNLFGEQPSFSTQEKCPNSYHEGLTIAFEDEQNTVDEYLNISDYINHYPEIRKAFKRAAKDEQNHAVWFLYLLFK